ncbi:hypothetical protein NQ318_003944 [Aromia moschata]|uniref:Uncharacterized protein n=1 Tax=Aromia moschata TaxID=1265417 RepID=A0AAV8Z7P0_9CUCU|nr:hypothetical protein NQ318_003944 [Aromia moschata]
MRPNIMGKCIVQECGKSQTNKENMPGVTFHRFSHILSYTHSESFSSIADAVLVGPSSSSLISCSTITFPRLPFGSSYHPDPQKSGASPVLPYENTRTSNSSSGHRSRLLQIKTFAQFDSAKSAGHVLAGHWEAYTLPATRGNLLLLRWDACEKPKLA